MRVIGTAGHVDHGKSTLVRALTGIDPDRLAEEQARQITIDLGFAWLPLPGGETLGIVDVPGHRDFIENMLAGVGGIDAAILVIAADEGVMPQTREHLAILDLLGVAHGLVALTKIDLIDDPAGSNWSATKSAPRWLRPRWRGQDPARVRRHRRRNPPADRPPDEPARRHPAAPGIRRTAPAD
ncbi:MAG: GTP-binding protein [Anaerolineae bacterium]